MGFLFVFCFAFALHVAKWIPAATKYSLYVVLYLLGNHWCQICVLLCILLKSPQHFLCIFMCIALNDPEHVLCILPCNLLGNP